MNVGYSDPDIPFLGIFALKFRYFVFAVHPNQRGWNEDQCPWKHQHFWLITGGNVWLKKLLSFGIIFGVCLLQNCAIKEIEYRRKRGEFYWARICKRLMSPEIDSEESIPPAYGQARQVGNWFLGLLKGFHMYLIWRTMDIFGKWICDSYWIFDFKMGAYKGRRLNHIGDLWYCKYGAYFNISKC